MLNRCSDIRARAPYQSACRSEVEATWARAESAVLFHSSAESQSWRALTTFLRIPPKGPLQLRPFALAPWY